MHSGNGDKPNTQWPRNVYGRDGKFRPTFTSETDRQASIFRATSDDLMSSNCTELHRLASMFSFRKLPSHTLPSARVHRPTCSELPRNPQRHTVRGEAFPWQQRRRRQLGSFLSFLGRGHLGW